MRPITVITIATALMLGGGAVRAQAPESPHANWMPPPESERCPSKWGAGDQRGSGNHMSPDTVMRAARLMRTGETFELSYELSGDMPLIGDRRFDVIVRHQGRYPEEGERWVVTEQVTTELGQVGTQLDAFAHNMAPGGVFYNCFRLQDIGTSSGMTALGVEKVGTLMTRGVLVDVAGLKGVEVLPETYAITREDIQQALARQNVTVRAGDAILVNTGWGKWYTEDKVRYLRSSPGLGIEAAEWLIEQDPMLLASDNCCIEVRPVGVGPLIHNFFLAVSGVHLIENVRLDELAAARAYEFAFIVQPLKIRGGTGSTVSPTAIR